MVNYNLDYNKLKGDKYNGNINYVIPCGNPLCSMLLHWQKTSSITAIKHYFYHGYKLK